MSQVRTSTLFKLGGPLQLVLVIVMFEKQVADTPMKNEPKIFRYEGFGKHSKDLFIIGKIFLFLRCYIKTYRVLLNSLSRTLFLSCYT